MSLTIIIVAITVLISWQAFNNPGLFRQLQHVPYIEAREKQYYRFISSGFVHGGWLHLLINMFVFYEFGRIIEATFLAIFGEGMGRINFLLLYLLAIIFADIPTFLKHRNNPSFASVGASGAVSAILFSYMIFAPWQNIYLYGIVPIPTIIAGVLYLAYSSWASRNQGGRIDHDAHFFGAVFGFLFTIVLKPDLFLLFLDRLMAGPSF